MIIKKVLPIQKTHRYNFFYHILEKKGDNLFHKVNTQLNKLLKHGVKVRIVNQGTKLSTRFEIKDQAKFEH